MVIGVVIDVIIAMSMIAEKILLFISPVCSAISATISSTAPLEFMPSPTISESFLFSPLMSAPIPLPPIFPMNATNVIRIRGRPKASLVSVMENPIQAKNMGAKNPQIHVDISSFSLSPTMGLIISPAR